MPERAAPRPYPPKPLRDARRIASSIRESNAGRPMNRILLADALGVSPGSSNYRDLIMSSYRYGLTEGNYASDVISLTKLGESLTAPVNEREVAECLRRAVRNVPIFEKMLQYYTNNKLPKQDFLKNALEREPFGIDPNWSHAVAEAFRQDATFVGFLREVGGESYVLNLADVEEASVAGTEEAGDLYIGDGEEATIPDPRPSAGAKLPATDVPGTSRPAHGGSQSVFISHGKNTEIVEQLKEIVQFGKFEPIVSVERMTVSKPVPAKVMDDMRSCFAGIIHVSADGVVTNEDGKPVRLITQNVLIEIGAAMALYGGNVILLVEEGTELPSNLQGLFEVRYSGETLDGVATMKVLKAFNTFEFHETTV